MTAPSEPRVELSNLADALIDGQGLIDGSEAKTIARMRELLSELQGAWAPLGPCIQFQDESGRPLLIIGSATVPNASGGEDTILTLKTYNDDGTTREPRQ